MEKKLMFTMLYTLLAAIFVGCTVYFATSQNNLKVEWVFQDLMIISAFMAFYCQSVAVKNFLQGLALARNSE